MGVAVALPRFAPLVGGAALDRGAREWAVVNNPYTNEPIAEVAIGTEPDLEAAIAAAQAAFRHMRAMSRHARREVLARAAERITAERGALAAEITAACGKPISQALGEVDRAALTFSFAADEARRFGGEVVPLDVDPRAAQMTGLVHRFPVGPVSAISPFNFPLNLLAHKVAPAIAVGSAVVVKPPPSARSSRSGSAPARRVRAAPGRVQRAAPPAAAGRAARDDPRFALLTFTGSPAVGWHLKSIAGRKKVVLELGGNAGAVVHDDAPDLDRLAQRLALGAFAYAGQVCIKVQRVLPARAAP